MATRTNQANQANQRTAPQITPQLQQQKKTAPQTGRFNKF